MTKPIPPPSQYPDGNLTIEWIVEVQHALATWPTGSLAMVVSTATNELHIRAMRSTP